MDLLKTKKRFNTVFHINKPIIDDFLTEKILKETSLSKKIGLDMSLVTSIQSKLFIDNVLKDKFKLFNLKTEIILYLSLIIKNGSLKSYMNYNDFSKDKRELFKRYIKVV